MKNKIEKESFNKKVSRIKKIVIKIIRTESKKKMLRDNWKKKWIKKMIKKI